MVLLSQNAAGAVPEPVTEGAPGCWGLTPPGRRGRRGRSESGGAGRGCRDPSGFPPPGEGLHRHTLLAPRRALLYLSIHIYMCMCVFMASAAKRETPTRESGGRQPPAPRVPAGAGPPPAFPPTLCSTPRGRRTHGRTDGRTPPPSPPLPPAHVGAASPRRPPAPVPREPLSPSPAAHRVAQRRLLAEHRVPHGRERAGGGAAPSTRRRRLQRL